MAMTLVRTWRLAAVIGALLALGCVVAEGGLVGDESCGCPLTQGSSPLTQRPLTFDGRVDTCCCEYDQIDKLNAELHDLVGSIVNTTFFRYFRVNMNRECPFWRENGLCETRHCAVDDTDEDMPAALSQRELSRVDFSHPGVPLVRSCDKDFCVLEADEDPESQYVNLRRNAETYTGYGGPASGRVWSAIYEENCFSHESSSSSAALGGDLLESCIEARAFFRLVSGMHASIAAHLSARYYDAATDSLVFNRDLFKERLGDHPERTKNLYFSYVVVLRAVTKLVDYLRDYQFQPFGAPDAEDLVRHLERLDRFAMSCPRTFDEKALFQGEHAERLKHEFKEHFRNISRITDCISCEKCRLWSKIQLMGYGTALKVLFEFDEHPASELVDYDLSRNELVALFQTLQLLTESVAYVQHYRDLHVALPPAPRIPSKFIGVKEDRPWLLPVQLSLAAGGVFLFLWFSIKGAPRLDANDGSDADAEDEPKPKEEPKKESEWEQTARAERTEESPRASRKETKKQK